jgi:hypothetical protein
MRLEKALPALIAGTLGLWVLLFFPARYLGGQESAVYSLVAAVLCLVPASLTLVWATRAADRPADQHLRLLAGTGVRMLFVLGVGLGLSWAVPSFQQQSFWIWLLIFYLFTLGLEMVLLRGR